MRLATEIVLLVVFLLGGQAVLAGPRWQERIIPAICVLACLGGLLWLLK